jgi:hypothetical protein
VVVALGGVPVLVDAGRPTYTAQTFGPDRYQIWTMRSGWHNAPLIRGAEQAPGRRYAARDASVTVDDARSGLALDLAGAYPRSDVRHWRRDAWLDRTTGRVTVHESWSLDAAAAPDPGAPTVVYWLAAGTVRTAAGYAEIDALDGAGTVLLTWRPEHAPVTMTVVELDDPLLSGVWGERQTRIGIDVSALGPTGTLTVTVEERR